MKRLIAMPGLLKISVEVFLNVLVLSGVYAIVALGLNIIFALSRVVNLAHVSLYTIGAYVGYQLVESGADYFVALLVVPIFVGVFGVILERIFIVPVRTRDINYTLILTYGLMFMLDGLVRYFWGSAPYLFVKFPAFMLSSVSFSGITYPAYRLTILILIFIVMILVSLLIGKTKIGSILRAASNIPDMVSCLGINMSVVQMGGFFLGCVLAGIAGLLAGPLFSLNPYMGREMLIMCFVVIVIGGLGSLRGTAIAAFLVAAVQTVSEIFFPELSMVAIFIMMAIILSVAPRGILGEGKIG